MNTSFVIQMRYLRAEWGLDYWHDYLKIREASSWPDAIKKAKRLQKEAKRCEYRVVHRKQETFFTAQEPAGVGAEKGGAK